MNGIMEESLVSWRLNGKPQTPFLCTGENLEALLTGFLITSLGFPYAKNALSIHQEKDVWLVETKAPLAEPPIGLERLAALPPLEDGFQISLSTLEALCGQVMALDNSAGLHAVLLSDGEQTVIGRDIGRHNALDKAVGMAARQGLCMRQSALCSSGRLSLEMLAKAAMAGIPVLATRKQVGSLCLAWGEKLHIALCRVGKDRQRWGWISRIPE